MLHVKQDFAYKFFFYQAAVKLKKWVQHIYSLSSLLQLLTFFAKSVQIGMRSIFCIFFVFSSKI